MNDRTVCLVAAIGCGLGSFSVLAGGDDAPPRESREQQTVEVRADAPQIDDAAAFATVLNKESWEGRSFDLAELMRRVPGARVRSYGGVGRFATVTLRGSSAEQTAVFVDGVLQNRALGGAVDVSEYSLGAVESVAVYRGVAPAAFGLAGMGGLIDIRTERAERSLVDVHAGAGAYDTRNASVSWSEPLASGPRLQLFGELLDSKGDFEYLDTRGTPFNPDDDRFRRRTNNDVTRTNARLRADWETRRGSLSAIVHSRRQEQGIPGPDSLALESTRLDEREAGVQFGWKRPGEQVGDFEFLWDGFCRADTLADPQGEIFGVRDQTTRLRGGGMAVTWRRALASHALTARVDLRAETARVRDRALDQPDRGGARRTLAGVTVEDRVGIGRWLIAPSARWELRSDDFLPGGQGTLPAPSADVHESNVSGKLAVQRMLTTRWSARASAGRFWRTPSLLELFGDRGAVRGNPALRPESGVQLEAGVSRAARGSGPWTWSGELLASFTDADDLVVFVANTGAAVVAQNVAAARIAGLEADFALTLPRALALQLSGRVESSEETSGGVTDGNPLIGRPKREGFAALRWRPHRWSLAAEVTYVGSNTTSLFDPARELPSRTLYDLFVSRTVLRSRGHRIDLDLELRNAFDHTTLDVARFPLPGRTVTAGLRWRITDDDPR